MKERIAQGSIKIFFFLILPSRIFLYYTTLILPEKCPIKYGVISVLYFPAFGLNTERYEVTLRIQSECGKIRTRNNSVFGHFSCSVSDKKFIVKFSVKFKFNVKFFYSKWSPKMFKNAICVGILNLLVNHVLIQAYCRKECSRWKDA